MQRHRHQEFIRFLNAIEAQVPVKKIVHVILDNYAAHKHPKVRQWLDRHPRFTFHFTPTSCSWLNAVEGFERWQKRDLSARRYVYVWADGVFLQARMEDHGECMLVLIGATPEGKKELIGFQVGVRESAQSWRELLVEVKSRGLTIAPEIAVGDGALGLWKALDEVFPGTRHQRCWVHKTANVLNKVTLSVQTNMKKDLREIYLAPNRASAEVAINVFAEKYGAKYDKAVECLIKDREALLALYEFPAEHWDHLRTTKRVCDGPAQDGTHERLVVVNHRQADGLQAALRGIKDLAASQRHKSVAEGPRRCQIRKRHRGHPGAGKPRRLIASSPKIPHSSGSSAGSDIILSPTDVSLRQRNLIKEVAGGLQAEFAIVLQALATLMRKLDGDPDQHPGEVCDYGIIPTETQSGADRRERRGIARAQS